MRLETAFEALPLIAILRGLRPDEAVEIATVLFEAGFRIVEVPLNSPEPLTSIKRIVAHFGDRMIVGAGTVLDVDSVAAVAATGAHLIVSPNFEPSVVRVSKERGLVSIPGVATPSEAFSALAAGADAIKLFPAEMIPPAVVRAMRAVLPRGAKVIPVGGITSTNIASYRQAGADAFGIGSALFTPGASTADVSRAATGFANAARGEVSR